MDSSKPTCFLSFPEDAASIAFADRLRTELETLGIDVLPPTDAASMSSLGQPFYWLRQADAVVLDATGDSTWVVYDAGAAQALNKLIIPVAQPTEPVSEFWRQLPPVLSYEVIHVAALADYVVKAIHRRWGDKG